MAENKKQPSSPRFGEPESISLTAVHPRGPWAGRARTCLRIAPLECSFRNPGPGPLALSVFELDPLRSAVDGSSAAGKLLLEPEDEKIWPLPPGQVGTLRLGGEGQLVPGRYSSRLVLAGEDGEPAASVPVTLAVKAHWLWAFSCVTLGLIFLGLLILLASQATLKERLAEALTLQEQLHELLENAPPTLTDLPLARQAKEDVAAAVESLTRPRLFGIKDLRLVYAERFLSATRTGMATIRKNTDGSTPGRQAVCALDAEWLELGKRLEAARQHLAPGAANPTNSESGFESLLLAVQHEQWRQRLASLPLAVEQGLGPHVDRAHLALAAGEPERARKLALHVTLWLRRAARQLEWESENLLIWRSFAGAFLARGVFLEQARTDSELPFAARYRLQRSLVTARQLLEPATLEGFRDADRELQQAEVELWRVRSKQLIERLQAAFAAVEERTSLERVDAVLEEMSPDVPKEVGLGKMLNRWRERISSVEEDDLQKRLLERVAALETLLESVDFPAMVPALGELRDAWVAYQNARTEEVGKAVLVPHCQEQGPRLRSEHLAARESLALLQPHPHVSGLEARLDLIGAKLDAGFAESTCLETSTQLSGELLEVGDRLFSTFLLKADLTPEARLASAEYSESAQAVALAQRLMQEPRPIRVELRTPHDEIRVDRKVTIEVAGLGPAWGPGTMVKVDFGDGSEALLRNAEELRQEPLLQHRYTRPERAEVVIQATQRQVGNNEPQGGTVGEGRLAIVVRSSPISIARFLGSFFLSMRFVLALAVGLLVQGWRLYDQHPFGSFPRDYLEAFALGVGVQGLIEGFSTVLVNLASGG